MKLVSTTVETEELSENSNLQTSEKGECIRNEMEWFILVSIRQRPRKKISRISFLAQKRSIDWEQAENEEIKDKNRK